MSANESHDGSSSEGRPIMEEILGVTGDEDQPQADPIDDGHTFSDDDGSEELNRDYTGVFEGPEKTLEVC